MAEDRRKLGAFRGPIMALLSRNPAERPSMAEFVDTCTSVFATTNTQENPKRSVSGRRGSDGPGSRKATRGTSSHGTNDSTYRRSIEDVPGQTVTETILMHETIPLQDEISSGRY
jgi:hypothetical protein